MRLHFSVNETVFHFSATEIVAGKKGSNACSGKKLRKHFKAAQIILQPYPSDVNHFTICVERLPHLQPSKDLKRLWMQTN